MRAEKNTVTKRVVVAQTETEITLTLTEEETKLLYSLVTHIGGKGKMRDVVDAVEFAIRERLPEVINYKEINKGWSWRDNCDPYVD